MAFKYRLPQRQSGLTPEKLQAMGAEVDLGARKEFVTTPANTDKSEELEKIIIYSLEEAGFSPEDIDNYLEFLYIERNNNIGGEFGDIPLNEKISKIVKKVLTEEEKKKADRCLRIARRKFKKSSAYRSGAIVRCRQGKIWKDLKEAKQVGVLYHFINSLLKILQTNTLIAKQTPAPFGHPPGPRCVSFTRTPHKTFGIAKKSNASLVIDGDKLSDKYKIVPFHDMLNLVTGDEMEERVYRDITNIDQYISKVILYNSDPEVESLLKEKNIPYKINLKETDDPQSGKAAPYGSGYSKVKEIIENILKEDESLRKWFKRRGTPGKEGGWVDCNTCRNGKCKPCGRKKGEKRAKYPSCRPTPAQCKTKGKGKKWGKTK